MFIAISRYARIIIFTTTLDKYYKIGDGDVERQIFNVVVICILLFYISSGVYTAVENQAQLMDSFNSKLLENPQWDEETILEEREKYLSEVELDLNFMDSLYFVVVTLLTVGYGEITPLSYRGKLIVIVIMVLTIVLIPRQSTELIRLMGMQSQYRRNSFRSPDSNHVLVAGNISVNSMKSFLLELFHEDHSNPRGAAIVL